MTADLQERFPALGIEDADDPVVSAGRDPSGVKAADQSPATCPSDGAAQTFAEPGMLPVTTFRLSGLLAVAV